MLRKFQFDSIRARLTFWFSIIAVLPLVLACVTFYNHMLDSQKASKFEKLQAIRDLKVLEVDNWLDGRIGDINTITGDHEIRALECIHEGKGEYTQEDIKTITTAGEILRRYLQNYNTFCKIFIISPENKRIQISTDEEDEGKDSSKDPYFTESLRTRKLFIKDIYFSKTEGKPCMAFSIPVFDLNDSSHIIGILVARIDLDKSLYKLLQNRTGMGETGETLIVNKDVIALNELRWYQNAPLNLKIKAKPATHASQGNSGIVETTDYRGEMVLAAYTHIPRTGWGFVAKQDLKEIYAPIYGLRNIILFIGATTLFAVLIVAFRISRSISEPIEALHKGSEIIEGGNLDYKIGTDSKDEIGRLSRRFDQTIVNLKNITASRDELNKEVTERMQAEEALRESGEKYRSMMESIDECAYICSPDFCVEYMNPAMIRRTGHDATGEHCYKAINALSEKCPWCMHEKVQKGESCKIEVLSPKDERFYSVSSSPIYHIDGSLSKMTIYTGITERKRSEEEHIRLSAALEQAHDLVKILGPDGTVQYINPATEKVMGYKREEIIGQNPFHIKRKTDDGLYNELRETIRQGKMWSGRQTNIKNDGTTVELETIISPIRDKSGNIINYISISRDVTNEANMEEQLRQSQKMEAIGTLAGGIAHEFNNILGAVLGYTELSIDDTAEGTLAHRNMKEILKAGHRAKDLVGQILKFSRQEKNVLIPLKLTPVVKEAIKFLRASLPSTVGVQVDTRAENDKVLSDVTQIHQIVLNLCTNAAHAMKVKGGVLEVRMDNVNIESGDLDNYPDLNQGIYLRLTVSDTGHGMDRAVLGRIFNPFFTTKQPGEGTGMGLSVIHGIVKSYGGTITVDSELEKGTTFQVLLPCTENQEAKATDEPTTLPSGSETIMLVDDDEALVGAGQQVLERLGYKVDARTSPVEALKAFRAQPEKYSLVITDRTMPNMTGVQFARELTAIRVDTPVILCTGYSEKVEEEEARAAGIQECLKKPLMRQDLAGTIRKVLDN